MSIFSETISKAISDYRYLLRRYLPQVERMQKLAELELKNPDIYNNDVSLYQVANNIIKDIEDNIKIPDQGYYSYSGIEHYCQYLKEYLDNYELENGFIIHKAQKASRAMIDVIQLILLPENRLSDSIAAKIKQHSKTVSQFGSDEQKEVFHSGLDRQSEHNPGFFAQLLAYFDQCERDNQLTEELVSQEEAA
jgi:hypothetical protein